jgi:hypothetical protein
MPPWTNGMNAIMSLIIDVSSSSAIHLRTESQRESVG